MQGASQPIGSSPRFFLYSGHDLGPIMQLLSALGAWDGAWAGYASMVTFELLDVTSTENSGAYNMCLKVTTHPPTHPPSLYLSTTPLSRKSPPW